MMDKDLAKAIRKKDTAALEALLAAGTDPNEIDNETGESVLAMAAESGDTRVVDLLLEAGADPNALGTVLWPLQAAAGAGHGDIVERLLFADADVDAVDEDGVTALGSAAAGGHVDIVRMLIDAGADPRHKDAYGNVAATYAINNGHEAVVELLLPFSPAKVRRRLELRHAFRQQKTPPDVARAFVDAAARGDLPHIRLAIERGIPVDVVESDEATTPLMWAANKGQIAVAKFLLEKGANVDRTNEYGDTALSMAAKGGQGKVYDYLFPLTAPRHRSRAKQFKEVIVARGQWKP